MTRARRRAIFVAAAVVAGAAPARGDGRAGPIDLVSRPLGLAAGQLAVDVGAEAGLAPRRFARPLGLTLDAWWGATPALTLGVITSHRALGEVAAGAGLCLNPEPLQCRGRLEDVGLDARWRLARGDLAVSLRGRLLLRAFSPLLPAVTLGAQARWRHGRFAVVADPYAQLGLAGRDQGNRAQLWLPLWLAVQPTCGWMVALHTGAHGEVAVLRDAWRAPLAVLVTARASASLEVTLEAGFRSLGGPLNTVKDAAALATVGWRR